MPLAVRLTSGKLTAVSSSWSTQTPSPRLDNELQGQVRKYGIMKKRENYEETVFELYEVISIEGTQISL